MSNAVEAYIATHIKPETEEIHGQCAWCGMVYDGPYAGKLVLIRESGHLLPHRVESYSHGCCPNCEERVAGRYKRRKQRRRTTPHEKDGLLYFL